MARDVLLVSLVAAGLLTDCGSWGVAVSSSQKDRRTPLEKAAWASPLLHAVSGSDLENTRTLLESGATPSMRHCNKLVVGSFQPSIIRLWSSTASICLRSKSAGVTGCTCH